MAALLENVWFITKYQTQSCFTDQDYTSEQKYLIVNDQPNTA